MAVWFGYRHTLSLSLSTKLSIISSWHPKLPSSNLFETTNCFFEFWVMIMGLWRWWMVGVCENGKSVNGCNCFFWGVRLWILWIQVYSFFDLWNLLVVVDLVSPFALKSGSQFNIHFWMILDCDFLICMVIVWVLNGFSYVWIQRKSWKKKRERKLFFVFILCNF